MSDLIERARAVTCSQPQDCYLNAGCLAGCCLVHELADEIERLRESLEIAENAYDLLANTHSQQEAEIERLRERCNECARRCGISDGKRLLMQPVIDAARNYLGDHSNESEQELFDALTNYDREGK